ncbi:lymphocyte antigen 6C1-like [Hoplias malabaricus]|uniref:lymphocyte antigen 6C1-like n=1 Tax=Hoplias malabaricus TaxID=27720 RepID=UPI00346351AD
MKPLVTLLLAFFLFSEASEALKCYACINSDCKTETCVGSDPRCITAQAKVLNTAYTGKGCVDTTVCNAIGQAYCCSSDLCNSAEGVYWSLMMILAPLLSFILFL